MGESNIEKAARLGLLSGSSGIKKASDKAKKIIEEKKPTSSPKKTTTTTSSSKSKSSSRSRTSISKKIQDTRKKAATIIKRKKAASEPKKEMHTITAPSLHSGLKPTTTKGYIGSPVGVVPKKGQPETGQKPYTGTKKETIKMIEVSTGSNIEQLEKQEQTIIPTENYLLGDSTKPVPGSAVIYKLQLEQDRLRKEKQKSVDEIQKMPEGTKFTKTKDELEVTIPESAKLEWSKYWLKKTEEAPPGVQQFQEAGVFTQTTMHSLARPVTEILGFGEFAKKGLSLGLAKSFHPFDSKEMFKSWGESESKRKYGIHYPSLIDIGLEPIGLAPKGTTELIGKYPVGAVIGGGGAEIAQGAGFTVVGGWAIKGASKGTKGIINYSSKAYSKLGRPGSKIVSKISSSEAGENIVRWGTKGYKKGYTLSPVTKTKIKSGVLGTQDVFKKYMYKPAKKVWFSPEDYLKAEHALARKIGQGYKFKGIFHKGLVRKTKFTNVWDDTRLATSSPIVESVKNKYGSLYLKMKNNLPLKATGKTEGRWVTYPKTIREAVDVTIKEGDITFKGQIVHGKKLVFERKFKELLYQTKQTGGLGKYQTPLPKKWISSYRKPFLINTDAMLKPPQTVTISPVKTGIKTTSKLTMTIPYQMGYTGIASVGYGVSKIVPPGFRKVQREDVKTRWKQEQVMLPISRSRMDITSVGQLGVQQPVVDVTTKYKQSFDTIQVPMVEQELSTVPVLDLGITPIYASKKVVVPKPASYQYKQSIKTPVIFPLPGLSGRGTSGWMEGGVGKRYRYREFKVKSLLKGWKF